jgi:hypothetical protein
MSDDAKKSNLVSYMANPRSFTLKKWFIEILKEDYMKHDTIIERVSTSLTTESDLNEFGKLITGVYERAYKKAVDDYQEQAEKLGIKVSIVAEVKEQL